MKRKFQSVTALSVFGALMGCAQVMPPSQLSSASRAQQDRLPVKVAAGPVVTQGASGADVLFSAGRYAHGAGQLEQAAQRYAQALELNPDHVSALNAMAVIHAQADRTEEALKLFARAMQLSPKAAHIHNNMGFALLRAGRLDEARAELQQAQELDPASLQTAQNMDLLAKEEGQRALALAKPAPDQAAAAQASGPQLVTVAQNVYELRMPLAQPVALPPPVAQAPAKAMAPQPVLAQATAPIVVQAAAAPAPVAIQPVAPVATQSTPPVVAQAAAPFVVIQAAAPAMERPAAVPVVLPSRMVEPAVIHPMAALKAATPITSALQGVRLEVSNGVGIARLARRTADRLAPTGVITARLTNARPFRTAKTEIQFVAGQDQSVQALQARLPVTAKAVAASRLERGVQIRLVLGHDVAGRAIAAWLDGEPQERLAELPQGGGWVLG